MNKELEELKKENQRLRDVIAKVEEDLGIVIDY